MRFKWDSNVARDIAVDLDRLEQQIGDCIVEVDHCATILQQMQSGEFSQAIEKYVASAKSLAGQMRRIGEKSGRTGRSVSRADEMFDSAETRMKKRAADMGSRGAEETWMPGGEAVTPVFYNRQPRGYITPNRKALTLVGPVWPMIPWIRRSVIIERISIRTSYVIPQWLISIIGRR